MNPTGDDGQVGVVRLTEAAAEAAQLGQWDVVVQCYQERGALLEKMAVPISNANALLHHDEQIRDRVHTAQRVLSSLISEAAATRHRLQALRQRLGTLPSAPEAMSVDA